MAWLFCDTLNHQLCCGHNNILYYSLSNFRLKLPGQLLGDMVIFLRNCVRYRRSDQTIVGAFTGNNIVAKQIRNTLFGSSVTFDGLIGNLICIFYQMKNYLLRFVRYDGIVLKYVLQGRIFSPRQVFRVLVI